MKLTKLSSSDIGVFVAVFLTAMTGCDERAAPSIRLTDGVVVDPTGMKDQLTKMTTAIADISATKMNGGGLVAAQGGAQVKAFRAGTHEVVLPLPQLSNDQIPIRYVIATTPPEAATEIRILNRAESNVVVGLQLQCSRNQEIQIDWASILLVTDQTSTPGNGPLELEYAQQTTCVQSGAEQVRTLANRLWPESEEISLFAANIQESIAQMKQKSQPRSLDAVAILESGGNWICTANANLAAALLRAKNIPARSIAVIPPTGQRLEMHRIVEYFHDGQWTRFDPSSLQSEIPLQPWQNIVMAQTTIADENTAMTPRMGVSVGCPYGQELEFLGSGMAFSGQDFFWTKATPVAQFDVSDEIIRQARKEWNAFLQTGKQSQQQFDAAWATDAAALQGALEKD